MDFKSQVYTTIEQSKRLIALGIKTETADCCHYYVAGMDDKDVPEDANYPAWSLHRLMEILPKNIGCYEQFVSCYKNDVMYINDDGYSFFNCTKNDNLYDGIIDCIKWAIVNRYINPQFLEGKQ